MIRLLFDFHEEPFEDCASNVDISTIDEHGRILERVKMGVLERHAVYDMLDKGEPLVLDLRYVKNFSLKEYRALRKLENNAVVDLVNFSAGHSCFDGDELLDFSCVRFTGEYTSFSNCYFGNTPISFVNCLFQADITDFSLAEFGAGTVNFQFASFESKSLLFDHARFQFGDVHFVNCSFGKCSVSFREADFGDGKVDFKYASFGDGVISFDKASFGDGDVIFKRVDFGAGKLDFRRTRFGNGTVDFSEADFGTSKVVFRYAHFGSGEISFQEAISHEQLVFDHSVFSLGSLSFFKAKLNVLSLRYCQFNSFIDLRLQHAKSLDLSHVIIRDIVDVIPTDQAEVVIEQMKFVGLRNLGNFYIDWHRNKVLNRIRLQTDSTHREKSQQFLVLKQAYNSTGRYADEDQAYVWYKRFELKADLEQAREESLLRSTWSHISGLFRWLLFDRIGLYATDPLRVLYSITAIYFVFSLLIYALPFVSDSHIATGGGEELQSMPSLSKAFYYSAITFLTVGYGDFYPTGVMRLLASVEGYVGVFLMGYFSVAFVRKMLR